MIQSVMSLGRLFTVRLHMLPGGYRATRPTPKGEGAGEAFFIGGFMAKITHSDMEQKAYNAWIDLRKRCKNPNHPWFHRYGGRGISVCAEWDSFDIFIKDMGLPEKEQSIDRINNDGNYCKDNCRWATAKQQANNRTLTLPPKTPKKFKVIDGKTYIEWSKELGVSVDALRHRMHSKGTIFLNKDKSK